MTTAPAVDVHGAIDADGHILEPPDLWETYLEPRYRDRAIRLRVGADGLEYFEFDGTPSRLIRPGFPGIMGGMGAEHVRPSPERTYMRGAPFGSMNAKERLVRLDQDGIEKAILYPTISLTWVEVTDPEISAAYCRAYNRWIVDFCSDTSGRLIPIAQISLEDPEEAARELERAVRAGAKGGFFLPVNWRRRAPGHPDYDRLWATAQELEVPLGIHPTIEPTELDVHKRYDDLTASEPFTYTWYLSVLAAQGMQQAFASLFHYGVFDRFPKVKAVVLESQASWIGSLLDRMDSVYKGPLRRSTAMKDLPSNYFRRQCWISADPDERALGTVIDFVGADRFFWASDFPHPDHGDNYMEELATLVTPLSATTRRQVLRENVVQAYGLDC